MTTTTSPAEYGITATTSDRGPVENLSPADVDLASRLDDMGALYRLYCGEATPADVDRLEIGGTSLDPAALSIDGCADAAHECADSFALEFRTARWNDDSTEEWNGPLARVRFLLTFGGPNVWLTVDYSQINGRAERVTLERYWGGEHDSASTCHHHALDVADSFVAALFSVE